jgi:GT2 family glycosyltransferase
MQSGLATDHGVQTATNGQDEISVVGLVATRDRPADLARLLECLAVTRPAAGLRYSLVVVDNSINRSAEAIVTKAHLPFGLRYLHEPRPGLSRARNAGLAVAEADYIATLDDDIVAPPDYLLQLEHVLRAHADAGVIGGRVELFNPDDYPISIRTGDLPERYSGGTNIFGFIPGCCQIIQRKALREAGVYDPRLGAGAPTGAAEDDDMVYRIWKKGHAAVYAPELVVFHNHGRRAADAERLQRNYMKGNGAFLTKHMLRLDANAFAQFRQLIPWCFKAIFTRGEKAEYAGKYLRFASTGALQFVFSILRR